MKPSSFEHYFGASAVQYSFNWVWTLQHLTLQQLKGFVGADSAKIFISNGHEISHSRSFPQNVMNYWTISDKSTLHTFSWYNLLSIFHSSRDDYKICISQETGRLILVIHVLVKWLCFNLNNSFILHKTFKYRSFSSIQSS